MYLKHSQLPKPAIYYQTDLIELENDERFQVFLHENAGAELLTVSDDGGVQNGFVCAFSSAVAGNNDDNKGRKARGIQVHANKERIREYLLQYHQYYSTSIFNTPHVISCTKLPSSRL